jgi:hypothetical protein
VSYIELHALQTNQSSGNGNQGMDMHKSHGYMPSKNVSRGKGPGIAEAVPILMQGSS